MTVETMDVPVEVVTEIKPSEALRLGRLVRPDHVTGEWFEGDRAACALGAIHLGWGGEPVGWHDATVARLAELGVDDAEDTIGLRFDDAETVGNDGDVAVLTFLAERGL